MVLAASFFSPEDFLYPEIVSQAEFVWSILTLLEKKLSSHTFSGILGHLETGVYLKNAETIEIQEGAYVESGAYICGPCIIGPYTQVRHGAYIRGGVITGAHSVVGHCSEVKNSYLGHYVK
ncbi:MAG: LpxA family transferase, partial [Chlamydia suis]|nr:LpxA family transferase [Chlamydia suis]